MIQFILAKRKFIKSKLRLCLPNHYKLYYIEFAFLVGSGLSQVNKWIVHIVGSLLGS